MHILCQSACMGMKNGFRQILWKYFQAEVGKRFLHLPKHQSLPCHCPEMAFNAHQFLRRPIDPKSTSIGSML